MPTAPPEHGSTPFAAQTRPSRPLLSVRWTLLAVGGMAFVFTALVVVGIARAWDPLPRQDMWDGYLGFWYQLTSGDFGAMWGLWNAHRIVLARVAFVIDLAVFHGAGWFLIVANLVAAVSIAAVFLGAMIVRLREARGDPGSRVGLALLGSIVIGLSLSWVQNQNFLWGFQIQFLLGVLLPLTSLVMLALARPGAPHSRARFATSLVLAIASVGTIASGLLTPFAAAALAVALRESRARIGALLVAGVACGGLYLAGFTSRPGATDSVDWLGQPVAIATYVSLYLGGPVSHATGETILGGLSVIVLLALLGASAVRWARGRDPSRMAAAMLAFAGFVLVGAGATALGRLDFGTLQANAGRYSTPALAAWAAAVVLIAPTVQEAVSRHRRPMTAVLAVIVLGLLAVQLSVFADVRQLRFERQAATLAIALGIPDPATVSAVAPDPARAVELGQQAMRDGLTDLAQPPYRNLSAELGTAPLTTREIPCDGQLQLRRGVPGTPFVRIEGTLPADPDLGVVDGVARIVDARGSIVGFGLIGPPDQAATSFPFLGYVLRGAGPSRFAGAGAACSGPLSPPPG